MISVLARGKVATNITKDATPIIVSQHSLCLAFHQHKVSHIEVVLFVLTTLVNQHKQRSYFSIPVLALS